MAADCCTFDLLSPETIVIVVQQLTIEDKLSFARTSRSLRNVVLTSGAWKNLRELGVEEGNRLGRPSGYIIRAQYTNSVRRLMRKRCSRISIFWGTLEKFPISHLQRLIINIGKFPSVTTCFGSSSKQWKSVTELHLQSTLGEERNQGLENIHSLLFKLPNLIKLHVQTRIYSHLNAQTMLCAIKRMQQLKELRIMDFQTPPSKYLRERHFGNPRTIVWALEDKQLTLLNLSAIIFRDSTISAILSTQTTLQRVCFAHGFPLMPGFDKLSCENLSTINHIRLDMVCPSVIMKSNVGTAIENCPALEFLQINSNFTDTFVFLSFAVLSWFRSKRTAKKLTVYCAHDDFLTTKTYVCNVEELCTANNARFRYNVQAEVFNVEIAVEGRYLSFLINPILQ